MFKKTAILAILVLLMISQIATSQRRYTADEIANLTFNDVTRLFRTTILPATVITLNNRKYTLDEIFNLVYDSTNHSLRVSGTGGGGAPDSLSEWGHAWLDTTLAKHYASKAGLAVDFLMRGIRGDTLAKYTNRHGNVVAWIDTTGSSIWNFIYPHYIRPRAAKTVNDTIYYDNDSTNVPLIWLNNRGVGTESVCLLVYAKIEAIDATSVTRSAITAHTVAAGYGAITATNTGVGLGPGIEGVAQGSGAGGYLHSAGGPGLTAKGSTMGAEFIGLGETLFVGRVVASGMAKIWADSSGQLYCKGVDLFPQLSVPTDSFKLWASRESLWYNDKNSAPHPIWPSGGGGGGAFGDTGTYYVSVASFGAGRDSIAGWYFSGAGALQKAINQASAGGTSTNRKTVYVLPGFYVDEPCTLKPYVNLVGAGKEQTIIQYTTNISHNKFTCAGARWFSIQNIQVQVYNNLNTVLPCSLAVGACSLAYFNEDFFTMNPVSGSSCKFVIYPNSGGNYGDTVLVENCTFGSEPQPVEYSPGNSYRSGELFISPGGSAGRADSKIKLKGCRLYTTMNSPINGTFNYAVTCSLAYMVGFGSIEFEDCDFVAQSNNLMYIYGNNQNGGITTKNCVFRTFGTVKDTVMYFNGYYGSNFFYFDNTVFQGLWSQTNYAFWYIYLGNCGLESENAGSSTFPITDNVLWNSIHGGFSYLDRNAGAGGYFGKTFMWDTTASTSTFSTPHDGMSVYKANASPNDSIYVRMDAKWRGIDRTWATGVDSVLANQASDTLAVTGIQTASFVEIQYESDPGVNIGFPYHTKTANQDIITWPVACVNKFYYRWRLH